MYEKLKLRTNNQWAIDGKSTAPSRKDFFYSMQSLKSEERVKDSGGNKGNRWSGSPSISAVGRYVAFSSYSSDLVPEDTNEAYDIFVHDLLTGKTTRTSVDSEGNEGVMGMVTLLSQPMVANKMMCVPLSISVKLAILKLLYSVLERPVGFTV